MTTTTDLPTLRLSGLNPSHDLADALARLEAQVREAPTSAIHRWALAEMLCVLGQWERALKQIQAGARLPDGMHASWQAKAQMLRSLVRAEAARTEVFAGRLLPVPVIDRPEWMETLARAISANAKGDTAEADALRRAALDAAPTRSGVCQHVPGRKVGHQDEVQSEVQSEVPNEEQGAGQGAEALTHQTFEWISDSDTRLGPVCELIVAGGYRWLAYADIAELTLDAPTSLLDLVWLPVSLTLRSTEAGAQELRGYLPTRYSGTDTAAAHTGAGQRDALLLSHLTRWQDVGETGVFALGQKTLMTPRGDLPLLEVRSLRMGDAA